MYFGRKLKEYTLGYLYSLVLKLKCDHPSPNFVDSRGWVTRWIWLLLNSKDRSRPEKKVATEGAPPSPIFHWNRHAIFLSLYAKLGWLNNVSGMYLVLFSLLLIGRQGLGYLFRQEFSCQLLFTDGVLLHSAQSWLVCLYNIISSNVGLVDDQKAGFGIANPDQKDQKSSALTSTKHENQHTGRYYM
jgi:hypothetical protein